MNQTPKPLAIRAKAKIRIKNNAKRRILLPGYFLSFGLIFSHQWEL
jgi:hypothetical protein